MSPRVRCVSKYPHSQKRIPHIHREIRMVPKKGLEPPHPCGYMDLNHARLPIPPLRLFRTALLRHQGEDYNTSFYRRLRYCQTCRLLAHARNNNRTFVSARVKGLTV